MPPKYEKRDFLGHGDATAVFRGWHTQFNREVAIKELREELRNNAKRRERFFREFESWAGLHHDHLAAVLEVDRAAGWIVLELLNPVAPEPVTGGIDPEKVRKLLQDALVGLDYLHRKGLLHGNLKPTNLLCDSEQRVKLCDGQCIRFESPGEVPMPTGLCKYIAPELLEESLGALGPPADLYSLGFVALEMLAGSKFESHLKGVGEGAVDPRIAWTRWHSSAEEKAPAARELVPGMPAELALVIDRLVSKRREDRYQQAGQVLEDLQRRSSPPGGFPSPVAPQAAHMPQVGRVGVGRPGSPPRGGGAATPLLPQQVPPTIASRPASQLVLRIASGPNAGKMVPFDGDELRIGDSSSNQLCFNVLEYPAVAGRSVLIRREADGWRLKKLSGDAMFLNQEPVADSAPLRSGDMVRMSSLGPDFQFIVQGAQSLLNLASSLIPGLAAARSAPQPAPPGPHVATAGFAPQRPATGVAPSPPAKPLGNQHPTGPMTPPSKQATAAFAPPQPARNPEPPKVDPKPGGVRAAQPVAGEASTRKSVLDIRQWDKNTKNWCIVVVAVIFLAVVIFLV